MGHRQEAAKLTRIRIVEAAKKLHANRSLSNVTVDEIVAEAKVSKGSFYVYFPRKVDIATEIAWEHFEGLEQKLNQMNLEGFEKISYFLKASVDYIIDLGLGLCKEWLKGAVSPEEGNCPGLKKLTFDLDFVCSCLRREKIRGNLRGYTPEEISDLVVAEYYGLLSLWCIKDGNFDLKKKMQFVAESLLSRINE